MMDSVPTGFHPSKPSNAFFAPIISIKPFADVSLPDTTGVPLSIFKINITLISAKIGLADVFSNSLIDGSINSSINKRV